MKIKIKYHLDDIIWLFSFLFLSLIGLISHEYVMGFYLALGMCLGTMLGIGKLQHTIHQIQLKKRVQK